MLCYADYWALILTLLSEACEDENISDRKEWKQIGISQFLLDLSQFYFSRPWELELFLLELDFPGSEPDRSRSRSTVWGDGLRTETEEGDGRSKAA